MSTSISAAASGSVGIGDLMVHRMGFGAMRFTGKGTWGGPPDRGRAKAVLNRALELGVTLIDTADSYGPDVSETLIGEALHPYPADLVIATKGGYVRPAPGKWVPAGRPEHLRAACEGSLRRLRLEQIPVYQLHTPDPDVPFEESISALVELKEQGKIRHIGISNVDEDQLRRAQRLTPIVSVQNRYNVRDRTSDQVIDVCADEGIAFLPWAPIWDLDDPVLVAIADRLHADLRQVALAWLLARSPTMLPIPGTGSVEHLEQNVAAASLRLEASDLAALTESARANQ